MVGLPKEYQDVFETSKDVVRLKQRHLLKEVLERLNLISLADETLITTLTNDQVRFFFGDILSLIVDSDSTIQSSALNAIWKFLSNLTLSAYQNSSEWPLIRDKIVEEYTKHISKVRDSSNNVNWYKIWCLLIQVLDQDIIKSVLIINKFLAIVEQSFKSADLEVRAQAFICWKALVKMFFKYNELIPTKRVKLVSIPFRSSQAKTLYAAETKFKAYWYFLVKLSESQVTNENINITNSLELHQDLVFCPFLQFCFGNSIKGGISTLKMFPQMKEMSIYVLIAMLNPNNKEIEVQLEKSNLEKPNEAIISEFIMKTNYKAVMLSCFEVSLMIVAQCNGRKKLFELLWHGLIHQVINAKNPEIYKACCSIIQQLIDADKENPELLMKPNISQALQLFGSHYNYLYNINSNTANYVQYFEIITCVTDILLLSDDNYFPINVFEPIIKNIYHIEKYKGLTKFWELQKDLIEYILTTDQLNDFTNFAVKVSVWKALSFILRDYMDANLFEFRLQSKYEIVNKWVAWPLKKCGWVDETYRITLEKILDNTFFGLWKKLMNSCANAEGRSNFIKYMIPSMNMLCDKRDKVPNFDEVLACYVDCMDKNFDKTSKPLECLNFIKNVFSKNPPKSANYNKSTEIFSNYICKLNDNQIGLIFTEIKEITTTLVRAEKLKYITKGCLELYKKCMTDLLKRDSLDKKYLKEFRSALKSDEFVIIPSVWALNPERLTEHQKEKMKEKKDHIPALYNDMNNDSHSQDSSSIKPWTPNKIVIPRGKEQLIISSPKATLVKKDSTEISNENENNLHNKSNINSPFKKPKDKNDSALPLNKSPFKQSNEKKSPNHNTKNPEISANNIENYANNDVEKMVEDSKEKEKIEASKNKTSEAKNTETKTKYKFTDEDEKLLKSFNIDVKDEKKKIHILQNLKALQIDTVEGKNLLKDQIRSNNSGTRTRKSVKPKRIRDNFSPKKISNNKESPKTNQRSRKSLTFEREKNVNLISKNKKNKSEAQDEEILLNKVTRSSNLNVPKNSKMEKLQISTASLNSEDEIIESSQKSESILTRRQRKSSFNKTTFVLNENETAVNKSPAKSSTVSPKTFNGSDTESNKMFVPYEEGNSRMLRSSSISPMIEDNDKKNTKITFTEKSNVTTEVIVISEMETELNTEFLQPENSNFRSPQKTQTLRCNNKDSIETKNGKIIENEPNTYKLNNESTLNNEANRNSISRNDLLEESENLLKSDFPSKSPRKRLVYSSIEENTSKDKSRVLRNFGKDMEINMNNISSENFQSLLQSPNGKKTRNNLDQKLPADGEGSPKVQKMLKEVCNTRGAEIIKLSPRKSPNLSDKYKKSIPNIADMETQPNTEIEEITEKTTILIQTRSRSPRKLPNWAKKNIAEMDTEPNTEVLNTSVENRTSNPSSPSTPKRDGDIYKYLEDRIIDSPAYSPIKPLNNSIKKILNQSIIASPECRNAEEKNAEFLNDTINISPIPVEGNQNEKKSKNDFNADRLFDELKASNENEKNSVEDIKHTSPTRKSTRPTSLNSPPDRKNTNNSTSPGPKTKTQSSLTGRGAQLINMIRNRKTDASCRFTSSPFRSPKSDELPNSQELQDNIPNPPSPPKKSTENDDVPGAPSTSLQLHPTHDLLTFSKTLPSPYASPSASILKRKFRKESLEDLDSPASKRKRVSFHDPPVSVTKEYVKHIEEVKPAQPRPIKTQQDRTSTPTNNSLKQSFKRKNRVDSMLELAKFNDSPHYQSNIRVISVPRKSIENIVDVAEVADPADNAEQLPSLPPNSAATTELQECDSSKQLIIDEQINDVPVTSVEMDSLKFNATADSTTNPQRNHNRVVIDEDDDDIRLITPSPSIYFTDEAAVLKYVVEKYGFDEIYERYSEKKAINKDFLTNKLVRTIFKDLAMVMEKDVRIRTNVLEMLSEKHPKEFLDHAIQENLSSVVCERLNTNSVIDYICETFKNNGDSRKMILDKISNILTTDRFNLERHEYFMKLLHYEKMSNDEIIDCIEIITKNRR